MKIAVLFEFSGIVRDAFRAAGHDAISFDLLESERSGPHHVGDVRNFDYSRFDMALMFPPCTHLAVSGARWFAGKREEQREALKMIAWCVALPVKRKAMENPVSIISSRYRKPDQIVHPHWFGHPETKATCLWLWGLPLLAPTEPVAGRDARVHREPPGPDRWKRRSRTLPGFANAMVKFWGTEI